MAKTIFILGGARSGKSSYALELAKKDDHKVAFVATATIFDGEMKKRIELHKKNRPSSWKTFEETKDLAPLLRKIDSKTKLVIIDCLTLFISNLLLAKYKDETIEKRVSEMMIVLKSAKFDSIIVSNEVGLGIVPNHPLGRRFRDLAGKINQTVAKESNQVYFMVSGIPVKIK